MGLRRICDGSTTAVNTSSRIPRTLSAGTTMASADVSGTPTARESGSGTIIPIALRFSQRITATEAVSSAKKSPASRSSNGG